jgi:hypothetical protein
MSQMEMRGKVEEGRQEGKFGSIDMKEKGIVMKGEHYTKNISKRRRRKNNNRILIIILL